MAPMREGGKEAARIEDVETPQGRKRKAADQGGEDAKKRLAGSAERGRREVAGCRLAGGPGASSDKVSAVNAQASGAVFSKKAVLRGGLFVRERSGACHQICQRIVRILS
ncbi:hypothetical protein FACS1894200_10450 [Spirochaetia bacterium]|nr:hypothetical protein FACS1894200_10450 [Spirochaetia bacterium]